MNIYQIQGLMNNPKYEYLIMGILFFAGVNTILWIMLPFAVFGIKSRLNKIVKELQIINEDDKEE